MIVSLMVFAFVAVLLNCALAWICIQVWEEFEGNRFLQCLGTTIVFGGGLTALSLLLATYLSQV